MTRNTLILLAAGGSAALLLGALAFQYLGGLPPCPMCIWQRWPHLAAVLLGGFAFVLPGAGVPLLGSVAAAATGGIGVYHTGVERGWWPGPDTCTAGPIAGVSPQELLAQIMAAPVVRCDEVPWEFLTLSMASWNAILSFGLAGLWLLGATRPAG